MFLKSKTSVLVHNFTNKLKKNEELDGSGKNNFNTPKQDTEIQGLIKKSAIT